MEEKYPIRFSLGQFIILLGIEVLVLALVFLLGARFGGGIFERYTTAGSATDEFQALDPDARGPKRAVKKENKLVSSGPEEAALPAEAPKPSEGDSGEASAEDPGLREAAEDPSAIQPQKQLPLGAMADKNTMVRFKSSGGSKFAIEVGRYSDETLAAREIARLKQKGYEAYLVIEGYQENVPSFAVRVGSFGDRKTAEDFSVKMSNAQGLELRVVQVD